MNRIYKRLLVLPTDYKETLLLWGSRQAGKSMLLKKYYSGVHWLIEDRKINFALCGSSERK